MQTLQNVIRRLYWLLWVTRHTLQRSQSPPPGRGWPDAYVGRAALRTFISIEQCDAAIDDPAAEREDLESKPVLPVLYSLNEGIIKNWEICRGQC